MMAGSSAAVRTLVELGRPGGELRLESVGRRGVEAHDLGAGAVAQRGLQVRRDVVVGQRKADLGPLEDLGQLSRPEQRHRGHRHAAGLEHGEPAGHQHRVIAAAQQHPAARHQAVVGDQHMRDAIGGVVEPLIGPGTAGMVQHGALAVAGSDPVVEQLRSGIEAIRVGELRHLGPVHPRPQIRGPAADPGRTDRRTRTPLPARGSLQDLPGDDQLLDLAGALVDAQGADLAIEPLDRRAGDDAAGAQQLHRADRSPAAPARSRPAWPSPPRG